MNNKLKEQLNKLFDDNKYYFSGYTGTPLILPDKIIPDIINLMETQSHPVSNGYKVFENDKVNSILNICMKELSTEQLSALRDCLIERTPNVYKKIKSLNMIKLIEALKKIEQCSDCGSYEATIIYMKSVASEALNNQQPSNEWVSKEEAFAFAEYCGKFYIRCDGGWFGRFSDQRNINYILSTGQIYTFYNKAREIMQPLPPTNK